MCTMLLLEFVAYVLCYKVHLISCFWKLPFSPPSAQISCLPALCCGIFFFLRFERLSYFPRLASVVFFSLAWLWLSSFPTLCYVILVFPALGSGCVVFLRLARVSCFPALVSEWAVFSALGSGRAFFPPRCGVRCFSHLTHTTANIFWPFIPSLVFRTCSLSSWFALVMQPMIQNIWFILNSTMLILGRNEVASF